MDLTTFRKVFGDGATVRVLDFFLAHQEFDYSMADVIREEGISYNTLKPIWEDLIRLGFIVPTRKMGKAQLYRVNKKSPIRKALWQLEEALFDIPETEELTASNHFEKKSRRKLMQLA